MSYEAIIEAARKQDEAALALALKLPEKISVDIRAGGPYYFTPAALLASENNTAAVEFLKKHNACEKDIKFGYVIGGHYKPQDDEDQGNYTSIAMGYALKGNVNEAEVYSSKPDVKLCEIGYAYARARNYGQAYRYHTQYNVSVDDIALGYVLAGDFEQVEIYRTQYKTSVDVIAFGFAMMGNLEQVEKYRTVYGASVDFIAKGFVYVGNHAMVETYRTKHKASIKDIAYQYALCGYIDRAERCLRLGADINVIVDGLKEGDHVADVGRFEKYAEVLNQIPCETIAQEVLYDYALDCLLNPIEILDDYEYKDKHCCALYFHPSSMPVRWLGQGPYDLGSLLKWKPKHPLLRHDFNVNHLHPARDIRNELAMIAEEAKQAENVAHPPVKKRRVTTDCDEQATNNNNNNNRHGYNLRKRG